MKQISYLCIQLETIMLTLYNKQTFTDKITSVNKKKYEPAFAVILLLQLFWSLPVQLFAQGGLALHPVTSISLIM